jgi:hypothetical protein
MMLTETSLSCNRNKTNHKMPHGGVLFGFSLRIDKRDDSILIFFKYISLVPPCFKFANHWTSLMLYVFGKPLNFSGIPLCKMSGSQKPSLVFYKLVTHPKHTHTYTHTHTHTHIVLFIYKHIWMVHVYPVLWHPNRPVRKVRDYFELIDFIYFSSRINSHSKRIRTFSNPRSQTW